MPRFPVSCMICCAVLMACASAPGDPPEPPEQEAETGPLPLDAPFLLAPGDQLEIAVYNAPELSRELEVLPDGTIQMTYAGKIQADGRRPEDVEGELEAALGKVLKSPDVHLLVKQLPAKKLFVAGAVASPGMYDMPGEIGALQAVIMAGGFAEGAAQDAIYVLRRREDGRLSSWRVDPRTAALGPDTTMRRLDIVYVPDEPGEVPEGFMAELLRHAPEDISARFRGAEPLEPSTASSR